jgi:hypothetical protein
VRRLDERQAVAVGRHQLDRFRLDLEERTGELKARILARHREENLPDQTAEAAERDLHFRLALDRRQRRKIGRRQTVHPEARLARLDQERPLVLDLEPHLVRDDGAHDLGELLGLNGEGPFALDLGRDGAGQRDIEIGGRELKVLARGAQEDMRKDRNRRAAFDDSLHGTEFCKEEVTPKAQFHSLILRSKLRVLREENIT